MSLKGKQLLITAAATLAVAGIGTFTAFHLDRSSSAQAAQPVPAAEVDVAPVIAKTITDWQGYSGRLEAIDKVEVRPLVSGTIVAVYFKDGSLVKKGDPLFTIDPRPYQAEVDRAAAQLAAAEAQNNYATTDFARAQRLITDNAIAKRDFDQKDNSAREGVANLKAAKAALETAQLNLSYTRVIAPVAGRVSRAEMTVGNIVSAGANSAVMTTLVSVSPIYASFNVDEQTYLQYLAHDNKAAVPVHLGLANEDGYSRDGVIDSVDNQLDTSSGTIRVRARFENKDGALLPGLFARVEVGGGSPHAAVLVDDSAVGTDQDKKYVMVVDAQDHAQYREVQLAGLHDGLRVVASGLKPGERIVVNGLQRVRPGDPVRPNAVQMAGTQPATQGS
jgi:membrane fusion protein, multidrug efflux system